MGGDRRLGSTAFPFLSRRHCHHANTRRPEEEATDDAAGDSEEGEAAQEEATAEATDDEESEEEVEEDGYGYIIGNDDSVLGVTITSPGKDTYVTVEIESPGLLETSRWSGTLDEADTDYTIYPPLKFNYKTLVANKQAIRWRSPIECRSKMRSRKKKR